MTTEVQSVIFPKNKFTEQQATNWIIKNNFTTKGKKIKNFKTTNFYRFRQLPPSQFKSYRIRRLKEGVMLVIGIRR
tara:strand:+ start:500 stop:727 length:228 start_codon:yes stop_codon:yes gene_type:complete